MNDSPLLLVVLIAGSVWLARLWVADLRAAASGHPHPRALPGAVPAPRRAVAIAVGGSLLLLAIETVAESLLGLQAQQSTMTVLFGVYTLAAAVVEEVVFRGYVVITNRGAAARWAGAVAASAIFAGLHPFLWTTDGGFVWTLNAKGLFSTTVVFVHSLWLYAMRFAAFNPRQSLLPCIAAHGAKNLGVFVIKAAQGFVVGWW